jgi:hypothetical protein
MPHIDWKIEAIDFTTCNCDFSCPCQFNARPTHDNCRAAVGFRIDKGFFGDTALDGVTFVALFAWPGAIHEGRGEGQLIIDEKATEDQRRAVTAIFKGEETQRELSPHGLVVLAGQDDDRNATRRFPEASNGLDPAGIREREVEQDDREVAVGELERPGGRPRDDGLEALAGERLGERLVDARLVLDEQDTGSGGLHSCML